MPTSNGLSYSMNSFPRSACTIGALSLPSQPDQFRVRAAQPAPPRMVIFSEWLRTLANNAISSSEGQTVVCCSRNLTRGSCSPASAQSNVSGYGDYCDAALRTSRFAWRSPAPAASARDERPVRSSSCIGRIDVPGGFPGSIRSRFHRWEFARRSPGPGHGCGGSRRGR